MTLAPGSRRIATGLATGVALGFFAVCSLPAVAQKAPPDLAKSDLAKSDLAKSDLAKSDTAKLDPAKLAAAKELMAAQGGMDQARKGLDQSRIAMIAEVRRTSPEDAEGFARFMESYIGSTNPKVTAFFEKVIEATTTFYAERCTVEELEAMTAFLKTPAGKKFIELAPEAAAGMAPHFIEFQKGLIADVQAAAQRGEFKKK